jgi:DNA adenine methylase
MFDIFQHLPPFDPHARIHEPFCGSAAFSIAAAWDSTKIVSDTNKQLINALYVIRKHPLQLSAKLEKFRVVLNNSSHGERKHYYYASREIYNKMIRSWPPSSNNQKVQAATVMLYLNRACFNGLYRVNSNGLFNVPFGDGKAYIPDKAQIMRWSKIMWNWTIKAMSFDEAKPYHGDFIFCDPPYRGVYQGYGKDLFWKKYGQKFAEILRLWDKKGVRFMVTMNDIPSVRNTFSEWNQYPITAPRHLNRDGNGRNPVAELIIVNYEEFGNSFDWGRTTEKGKREVAKL